LADQKKKVESIIYDQIAVIDGNVMKIGPVDPEIIVLQGTI